jgi:predicted dehydrogenase
VTGLLGVGLLGAGPVTQAIHLPALSTIAGRLRVVHVMDVDPAAAAAVAGRAGARWSTEADSLVSDPDVDIVVVCSPHQFHAAQAGAACLAGKRAVLCEKPLAESLEDAQAIADVSARTGVPVIVGTMHLYDPAFAAARAHWQKTAQEATFVRSLILLPGNDELVNLSTDLTAPPPSPPPSPPRGDAPAPEMRAAQIRGGLLGLAIHNTPLLRMFFPAEAKVTEARLISPFGYSITLTDGCRTARLAALIPGRWDPAWTFQVWSPDQVMHVAFPPSYVLAGSATATVTGRDGSRSWHFPDNGYQAEWQHVADVADRAAPPRVPLESAVADLGYTIDIADQASRLILEG